MLGDIINELYDVADFLRAFAETLNALRRVLNRFANRIHAIDCAAHGLAAFVRHFD